LIVIEEVPKLSTAEEFPAEMMPPELSVKALDEIFPLTAKVPALTVVAPV
jgi:hypothetical protein